MLKNGKLLKNNKFSSKEKKSQRVITIVLLVITLIITPCMVYGFICTIVIAKTTIDARISISAFYKNIAPQLTEHITNSKVRFELHRFEEILMPQFYIDYAPDLEIRFHTVIGHGKNTYGNKNPLLGVYINNLQTKESCSFDCRGKNYDFLSNNPSHMIDKLLSIYDNRQIIIDDFVAEKPECF